MKTTIVGKQLLLITALGIILPFAAHAQTVLYSDDFSTAGKINGSSLDTSFNGAKWLASTTDPSYTSNGTAVTLASTATAANRMASLDVSEGYFSNNPGVYTLSADVAFPSGSSTNWVGLGFSDVHAGTSEYAIATNPGAPWIMLRQNGDVTAFKTQLTSLPGSLSGAFPGGSTYTLKLVLNTTISTAWTLDAFVNTTQLDLNAGSAGSTFTFITNPAIRYVGFSSVDPVGAPTLTVDNFLLTSSVPEPRGYGLLLMGGLFLIGTLKKYRSQFIS